MFAALVENRIAAAERETGANADWMRDLYRAAPALAFKFARFLPLSRHRRAASREALAVTHLVAVLAEDCGPCVQIAVNLSLKAGVDPALLRAVIEDRAADLGPELEAVHDYARAVATGAPDAGDRAEALRERLGAAAAAELAMSVATARVFPALKRGLGHGLACSQVTIEVPGDG